MLFLDETYPPCDKTWNISDIIDLHGTRARPGNQGNPMNSIIGFVMKAGKRDAMPEKTDVAK